MEDEQRAPSGAITVSRDGAYRQVDGVATWSPWEAFEMAAGKAPILPGVYMMRTTDGTIVYVGMAGERPGGGKPSGMRGRLRIYVSGKALLAVSVKARSTGRLPIRGLFVRSSRTSTMGNRAARSGGLKTRLRGTGWSCAGQ